MMLLQFNLDYNDLDCLLTLLEAVDFDRLDEKERVDARHYCEALTRALRTTWAEMEKIEQCPTLH